MFSLLTMLEAHIAYSHKSTYIYIHNKLNIVSNNSACIELLQSLLFTLYTYYSAFYLITESLVSLRFIKKNNVIID